MRAVRGQDARPRSDLHVESPAAVVRTVPVPPHRHLRHVVDSPIHEHRGRAIRTPHAIREPLHRLAAPVRPFLVPDRRRVRRVYADHAPLAVVHQRQRSRMSPSLLRATQWLLLAMCLCLASCAVLDNSRPGYPSLAQDMAPDSGLSLHYETYGHGKPVVLIHGLGVNSFTWRHLIAPRSHHHRALAVELKGHGTSPKPDDNRYSLYDQSRLVSQFIIDHDLRNVTLVGHSYGDGVALASAVYLSRAHPGRLERLVLIDSIAYKQSLPLFVR